MIHFDHIAIAANTLAEGVAHVEAQAGITIPRGGVHPNMGTHNCVAAFSGDSFVEIIAVDPDATPPGHKRWFDLDTPSQTTAPHLHAWVCRSSDLEADIALAAKLGIDYGKPLTQTRGNLTWRFAVRDDGKMPLDGAAPMLMQWSSTANHPASAMPQSGATLETLLLTTPHAEEVNDLLIVLDAQPMPFAIAHGRKTKLEATLVVNGGKPVTLL